MYSGEFVISEKVNEEVIEEDQAVLYATKYIKNMFLNDSETPFRYDIENDSATDVKLVYSTEKDSNDYYIITFSKEFNGRKEPVLVTTVDAKDGTFGIMTKGRVLYKKDVITCVKGFIAREFDNKSQCDIQEPKLIFKMNPISIFKDFPLWEINVSIGHYKNITLFIDQMGRVYTNITSMTAEKIGSCPLNDNYISKEHAEYAALRDIDIFEFRNKSDLVGYLDNLKVHEIVLVNSLESNIPDYYAVSFTDDKNKTLIAFVDALGGWLIGLSKDKKIIREDDIITCIKNNTDLILKSKGYETKVNLSVNISRFNLVLKKRSDIPDFIPLWQINISNVNKDIVLFIDQNGTVYNENMYLINYIKCNPTGYTNINYGESKKIYNGNINSINYNQLILYSLLILIIISIFFLIRRKNQATHKK